MSGITKRFAGTLANDRVDLALAPGEVVALLGENGAGKTTLMNILFGHYTADAGEIRIHGEVLPPGSPQAALKAGVGMVHQHFTLADNMTVLDNVLLGTEPLWSPRSDRRNARRRLDELGQTFGLGVRAEALVRDLSIGERQRVEILKALYRKARFLILDEPTAVLTPQESERLFDVLGRLVAEGLGILFISHKLKEVMRASERVVVLRGGRVVLEGKTAELSRAALAEAMVGRAVAEAIRGAVDPGEVVLALDGVQVLRDGRPVLDDVTFEVRRHEIVGIAGVAGNGQTPLAGLLSGLVVPSRGTFELKGQAVADADPRALVEAGVARIPEDRHEVGVIGDMTVGENALAERYHASAFNRFGWFRSEPVRTHVRAVLTRFRVVGAAADAPARLLSGGNMQRLILGRALIEKPDLILAHQPTRGLDVGAIADVHRLLIEARARG
ncbi:MAG: ABC transporter ATP-binding protein, partial [Geminicoccaceae bacterium]|nr:ABC transporter ATP-binding protein [Geminicoccaceae bacterium]